MNASGKVIFRICPDIDLDRKKVPSDHQHNLGQTTDHTKLPCAETRCQGGICICSWKPKNSLSA